VHTTTISNSGSACKAGLCAIDANPRFGLSPTIPTRILLLLATGFPPRLAARIADESDYPAVQAGSDAEYAPAK
jgi:hypothetical protein